MINTSVIPMLTEFFVEKIKLKLNIILIRRMITKEIINYHGKNSLPYIKEISNKFTIANKINSCIA